MKKTTLSQLILLTLITYTFIGCAKQEPISSAKSLKTINTVNNQEAENKVANKPVTEYGPHTNEIQEILSATPLGSEIYLEQKESGEWYLKIEKTFTAKKNEEKTEIIEPIYGESILI